MGGGHGEGWWGGGVTVTHTYIYVYTHTLDNRPAKQDNWETREEEVTAGDIIRLLTDPDS